MVVLTGHHFMRKHFEHQKKYDWFHLNISSIWHPCKVFHLSGILWEGRCSSLEDESFRWHEHADIPGHMRVAGSKINGKFILDIVSILL